MLQRATPSAATEVLAGLVERVTFHNEDSGFCVLRIKARGQRELITVLGHAAMISAGEFVQASGAWINDRVHGVRKDGADPSSSGHLLRARRGHGRGALRPAGQRTRPSHTKAA